VFSVERKRGCPNAPELSWWLSALLMTGNLSNRNWDRHLLSPGKPGREDVGCERIREAASHEQRRGSSDVAGAVGQLLFLSSEKHS
jgi:hypothetical protein